MNFINLTSRTTGTTASFARTVCSAALAIGLGLAGTNHVSAGAPSHGVTPPSPNLLNAAPTVELANPFGTDALTPTELANLRQTMPAAGRLVRPQMGIGATALTQAAPLLDPIQFLYSERHDEEKDADPSLRRADVFYYDYTNDSTILRVVNLSTGLVDVETRYVGRQPAISRVETNAAVQILLDHPNIGPALRALQLTVRGTQIISATDVSAQAGVFFPDSVVGTPLEEVTGACKTHRCAQLFLPHDDARFIDASTLVVDLSAGQVLWVDTPLTAFVKNQAYRVFDNTVLPVTLPLP